ncbi:MAG: D-alanyl-D-alanine carboxypeptidase/D-alanyl-D-alanine-endopeptidase [Cyanobacteria bacterium P01_A01_bin.45]
MSKKISIGLLFLLISAQLYIKPEAVNAQVQIPTSKSNNSQKICSTQLPSKINRIINSPQYRRSNWGILIKKLTGGQTLYSRNSEKYFTPASVTKLFTTSAALLALGKDYRIRTSIYQDGNGILRVVGRGDPSLTDKQLDILSQQLRQKGIRRINQLVADDSYFQGETVHPSWMWEDVQFYYGTHVNSLILNENASIVRLFPTSVGKPPQVKWDDPTEGFRWKLVNNTVTAPKNTRKYIEFNRDLKSATFRINGRIAVNSQPDVTAIAVFDPVEHFIRKFRASLLQEKISVGRTINGTGKNNQQEIAAVNSPSISELIKTTNVDSNNLFAEALLKTLAFKKTPKPNQSNQPTSVLGLEVLQDTLEKIGVDPKNYSLVDGSGLSRKNLISPQALVQLLQGMARVPQASIFYTSLPNAGKTGTVKSRFSNTAAEGIVLAKTGTMTGVVSLAGYVNVPNYQPIVFSILTNNSQNSARITRKAIDEIVVAIAQLRQC